MNRSRGLVSIACAAAAIALFGTCAPVPIGDGPRRQLVRSLTEQVVEPTFDDVIARAAALTASLRVLADAPLAAELQLAQLAWRDARIPWKECDAFGFGPAADARLAAAIDFVAEPDRIETEIAGAAPLTDAYIDNLGANRKGFHAIEYLLFRGGDNAAVLASLTGAAAARRRDYLVALGGHLERTAGALRSAWFTGGGAYAELVVAPGAGNATYPTIKSVIDKFVNESVFLAEFVADTRLGKPLGLATGGTPQPNLEESGESDNSLADMTGSLHGIRNIYFGARDGTPGGGIGALVAARSPVLDREVRELLDGALAAVGAIPRPFRTAIVDHRAAVQAAYDAVKELKRVLAADVIGILGTTPGFNDNDGD